MYAEHLSTSNTYNHFFMCFCLNLESESLKKLTGDWVTGSVTGQLAAIGGKTTTACVCEFEGCQNTEDSRLGITSQLNNLAPGSGNLFLLTRLLISCTCDNTPATHCAMRRERRRGETSMYTSTCGCDRSLALPAESGFLQRFRNVCGCLLYLQLIRKT